MKNNLRLDSKSGAGSAARYNAGYVARGTAKEAVGDKEPIHNKSVYYSRYYSPLDYFLERASRWVLVFAFLYMLAQIVRAVIR